MKNCKNCDHKKVCYTNTMWPNEKENCTDWKQGAPREAGKYIVEYKPFDEATGEIVWLDKIEPILDTCSEYTAHNNAYINAPTCRHSMCRRGK